MQCEQQPEQAQPTAVMAAHLLEPLEVDDEQPRQPREAQHLLLRGHLLAARAVDAVVALQRLRRREEVEALLQRALGGPLGQLHGDVPARVEAGGAALALAAHQLRHQLPSEQIPDLHKKPQPSAPAHVSEGAGGARTGEEFRLML